ncbi:MAG: hypothetical protein OXG37_12250 [Actinomycetia bacterium]|nr:hypothetical protein [Actinomycetes bacterium]
MAHTLARAWELPVCNLLRRSGEAPRQRGLTRSARCTNVAGTFSVLRTLSGTVCVVDDVYTSGATLSACASALRRAGARRVEAMTFARAIRGA